MLDNLELVARPEGVHNSFMGNSLVWLASPNQGFRHDRPSGLLANPYQRRAIQEMRDGKSYVYFIGGERGPVKIGMSIAPLERLASLQISSPIELFLWAKVEGSFELEAEYHARFAAVRLHGEWFTRSPALRAEIRRLSKS